MFQLYLFDIWEIILQIFCYNKFHYLQCLNFPNFQNILVLLVDKKNIYSSNKNKVNSNIVKKYNENNNVFKKKTSLIDIDKIKKILFGTNNDKKQNLDNFNFKIHKSSKNTNSINTNMFSNYLLLTKEKTTKNIIIGEHDNIISGKEKSEIKDNSLFETFANNSDDSSFLSSSPFDW